MAVAGVQELNAVRSVTSRLKQCLDQASLVKQTTTVEPALSVSDLKEIVGRLLDDLEESYDQAYRHAAVETAARDTFYTRISSTTINDPDFVEIWNLLDILIIAGDSGICGPELSVWLIEELLDSQTTEGCRTVFDYLESRREQLAQKDFHKKNLVFLRSCNELLRRLSRAEDAAFCGRVFFFLFQTFPLGDKSSVNLRGEYHVENATLFDKKASFADSVDVEDTADASASKQTSSRAPPHSKALPIKPPKDEPLSSAALYPIFWQLQQAFSEPTRLFRVAEFKSFRQGLDATLLKFKKTTTVVQTSKQSAVHKEESTQDNYNPKYLTSRDLFDLELSDLAFQRHILVQSLILMDFLLSLTEKAKQRLASLGHTNKSLMYDFTLTAEDAKWVDATRKVIKELFHASPDGRFYDRMVDTILARDKNWVRWKIESCPSIIRDAVTIGQMQDSQKAIARAARPSRVPARLMEGMNLSFLDDSSAGGLDALRSSARSTIPTDVALLDGIRNDELDLDMAMNDDERTSIENTIQNKTWRLLRAARVDNLDLLAQIDDKKSVERFFRPAPESNGDVEMTADA